MIEFLCVLSCTFIKPFQRRFQSQQYIYEMQSTFIMLSNRNVCTFPVIFQYRRVTDLAKTVVAATCLFQREPKYFPFSCFLLPASFPFRSVPFSKPFVSIYKSLSIHHLQPSVLTCLILIPRLTFAFVLHFDFLLVSLQVNTLSLFSWCVFSCFHFIFFSFFKKNIAFLI